MKIQYNPKLKILARSLRNRSTLAEVLLWNQLKARKVRGYQFMRQKPIDNYIVDFYCSKLQLIIEIDGSSHDFKFMND
jgi:very-short-patch-repair endonuclease